MAISAKEVKALRDETGLGMMDCKKALVEADGDKEKAKGLLRKMGLKVAEMRAGRSAKDGTIGTYVHFNGKLGVMVEVNCETDFVARSDNFKDFVQDVAMHIASAVPTCVSREDLDQAVVEKEKAILVEEVANIPEASREKALEGKLVKGFYAQHVLLDQPFVKDDSKTVGEVLNELVAKCGEKCQVTRFSRMQLGEE